MNTSDSPTLTAIYVRLLGEGVDVWRPVDAERVGESLFRIVGTAPEGETWEFLYSELVWCRPKTFADGTHGLEAYSAVTAA